MQVDVKIFASLREQLGFAEKKITVTAAQPSVLDLWCQLTTDQPPENLLAAINHEYVALDASFEDGDEVAFFPPVTGG